jgi:hypothetical protein
LDSKLREVEDTKNSHVRRNQGLVVELENCEAENRKEVE